MALPALATQLASLGLTDDETRVYLTLLEIGRGFVSVIAKRAGVPRVNCYHLLDSLVRKGVASASLQRSMKVYEAEPPEVLVKQQVERLRIAEKMLPDLKQLSRTKPAKVSIRPVEGEAGIRSIFEETLTTAGEIIGYSNLEQVGKRMHDYLHYYAEERSRRRIRARLLSPFSEDSRRFLDTYFPSDIKRELTEIVFVDPVEFPFESEVYIFGNSVATFSLRPKELIGVVVESAPFAQTYRSMFNLSWLGATTFVLG